VRNTSFSVVLASFMAVAAFCGSLVTSTGCGGSGGAGGGDGGNGGGGASACFDYASFDGTKPPVSFKDEVLPIMQRSCGVSSSCHGDSTAPNENRPYLGPNKSTTATDMDISIILGGIVDVGSFYEESMSIVKPNDPENSFLMHKLDDTLGCDKLTCAADKACGGIMPQGAEEPIDIAERDLVRRWIAQGAANN
jgi:hypothetical protein